jgi:hypothetical protein
LYVIFRCFGAAAPVKNTKMASPDSQPVFTALVASGWLAVRLKVTGAVCTVSFPFPGFRGSFPHDTRTDAAARIRIKYFFIAVSSYYSSSKLNPLYVGEPFVFTPLSQITPSILTSRMDADGASLGYFDFFFHETIIIEKLIERK